MGFEERMKELGRNRIFSCFSPVVNSSLFIKLITDCINVVSFVSKKLHMFLFSQKWFGNWVPVTI